MRVSKARLIITAVVLEGRSASPSRTRLQRLAGVGVVASSPAIAPRVRRRSNHDHADPEDTHPGDSPQRRSRLVLQLRRQLAGSGLDAGADTIAWHLEHHHHIDACRGPTIHRILSRQANLVVPSPKKRPRSSYIRFAAEQPNEYLAGRLHPLPAHRSAADAIGDPHLARRPLPLRPVGHRSPPVTGLIVVDHLPPSHRQARHPGLHLDRQRDGLHHPVRPAGTGGRNALENELRRLRHLPEELPTQPPHHLRQSRTLPTDASRRGYAPNPPSPPPSPSCRPCSTPSSTTTTTTARTDPCPTGPPRRPPTTPAPKPAPAPTATATPTTASAHDRVDTPAVVTLRLNGRLHHIGIGRTHARTHIILLIHDLDIRVVDAATGELLRELTLDPTHDYQPTGRPPGPIPKRNR